MRGAQAQGFDRARRRVQGTRRPTEPGCLVARQARRPDATAFTLIELLVVIVIIGVLAALVLTVSAHVSSHQKASTTKNTMRLVRLAIDQFAETNPLQSVYDNAKLRDKNGNVIGRTFGPYPPYQLANASTPSNYLPTKVAEAVEPYYALGQNGAYPQKLEDRLARDLSGGKATGANWASVDFVTDHWNDDIRSLYAYLAVYAPGVLSQLPDSAKKVLPGCTDPANKPEMVNPTGKGTVVGSTGAVNVLGINDAWDIPLDYFLQVKLEWMVPADGGVARWVVTDRVPVLRSRAITQEQLTAEQNDPTRRHPQQWIFSETFPQPGLNGVDPDKGTLPTGLTNNNGWVRVRAGSVSPDLPPPNQTWDNYKYLPEQ